MGEGKERLRIYKSAWKTWLSTRVILKVANEEEEEIEKEDGSGLVHRLKDWFIMSRSFSGGSDPEEEVGRGGVASIHRICNY